MSESRKRGIAEAEIRMREALQPDTKRSSAAEPARNAFNAPNDVVSRFKNPNQITTMCELISVASTAEPFEPNAYRPPPQIHFQQSPDSAHRIISIEPFEGWRGLVGGKTMAPIGTSHWARTYTPLTAGEAEIARNVKSKVMQRNVENYDKIVYDEREVSTYHQEGFITGKSRGYY